MRWSPRQSASSRNSPPKTRSAWPPKNSTELLDTYLDDLFQIKEQLLSVPKQDIEHGLRIASSIRGLGIAGASGLLTLMYPEHFATVAQFVVKALREVDGLPERAALDRMKPEGLKLSDGVVLIQIMREKAADNNRAFGTDAWTPKRIDEILWTYGR